MNHLPLQCRIMRQTLSNLTFLPHQIKTAVPNWFRRRSFAVLNTSVRFGTWVKRRLNRALTASKCRALWQPNVGKFLNVNFSDFANDAPRVKESGFRVIFTYGIRNTYVYKASTYSPATWNPQTRIHSRILGFPYMGRNDINRKLSWKGGHVILTVVRAKQWFKTVS